MYISHLHYVHFMRMKVFSNIKEISLSAVALSFLMYFAQYIEFFHMNC